MDSYQRRPADAARTGSPLGASDTINDATAFLRRLIPFSGPEVLSPLSLLSLPAQQGGIPSNPLANALPRHRRRAGDVDRVAGGVDPR